MKAFISIIIGVWQPKKQLEISEISKNLFMFQFIFGKDKQKVLD